MVTSAAPSSPIPFAPSSVSSRGPQKRYARRKDLSTRKDPPAPSPNIELENASDRRSPVGQDRQRKRVRVDDVPSGGEDVGQLGSTASSAAHFSTRTAGSVLQRIQTGTSRNGTPSPRSPTPEPEAGPSTPTRPRTLLRHEPSPKDLSSLFSKSVTSNIVPSPSTVASVGTPKRPGGLRRMLTKTQSLGSALARPVTPPIGSENPGQAHVSAPSTPSRTPAKTSSLPSSPFDSPSRMIKDEGRIKRTYGGFREVASKLEAESLSRNTSSSKILTAEPTVIKTSYAELRKRYEVDNELGGGSLGSVADDTILAQAPQPISDMRSKGENRRFLDEIGYLVEGLLNTQAKVALRRNSAIDVVTSMQTDDWTERMHVCGQTEKVWDALQTACEDGDPVSQVRSAQLISQIIESACLLFAASMGIEGQHRDMFTSDNFQDMLFRNLSIKDACLDECAGSNRRLRRVFTKLPVKWQTPKRRLASFILKHLTTSVDDPSPVLEASYNSLQSEIQILSSRLSLPFKGVDLFPDDINFDQDHLSHLMEMISDLIMQARMGPPPGLAGSMGLVLRISQTMFCDVRARETGWIQLAQTNTARALKVLACLQTISPTSTTPEMFPILAWVLLHRSDLADPSGEMSAEDILCLVLALYTTGSSALVTGISRTVASPDCRGESRCSQRCRCPDAIPLMWHLSELYGHYRDQKSESLIIAGHLALVLTRAILATGPTVDTSHLQEVLDRPPRECLKEMMETLEELQGMQAVVHRKMGELVDEALDDGETLGHEASSSQLAEVICGLRDLITSM